MPHEGDAVAVLRVHVGLDLEDEAGDLVALRLISARLGRLRPRRRGDARDRVDQFGDAEILQRDAEVDRGQVAVAIGLEVELGIAALRQLDLLAPCRALRASRMASGSSSAVELRRSPSRRRRPCAAELEIVDALELAAHADRPAQRADVEREHVGDLVEQLERVAPSRSTLLTKVMIGTERSRQTSNSLRVCGSMPLAASITMTAESTAVSVR